MIKDGEMATLSIPDHKEVARGTLRSLIARRESRWKNSASKFNPMKIRLFIKTYCPWCHKAQRWLDFHNLPAAALPIRFSAWLL